MAASHKDLKVDVDVVKSSSSQINEMLLSASSSKMEESPFPLSSPMVAPLVSSSELSISSFSSPSASSVSSEGVSSPFASPPPVGSPPVRKGKKVKKKSDPAKEAAEKKLAVEKQLKTLECKPIVIDHSAFKKFKADDKVTKSSLEYPHGSSYDQSTEGFLKHGYPHYKVVGLDNEGNPLLKKFNIRVKKEELLKGPLSAELGWDASQLEVVDPDELIIPLKEALLKLASSYQKETELLWLAIPDAKEGFEFRIANGKHWYHSGKSLLAYAGGNLYVTREPFSFRFDNQTGTYHSSDAGVQPDYSAIFKAIGIGMEKFSLFKEKEKQALPEQEAQEQVKFSI